MSYTATATRSQTTTVTEARVRTVMQKVEANLMALYTRGLISLQQVSDWSADVTHLQLAEAIDFFEVQMLNAAGKWFGLRYRISSDGSIHQDSPAGGIDLYGVPKGTPTKLYAHTKPGMLASVRPYLERRGWAFDGKKLEGNESTSRAFSSDGYAVTRSTMGNWPT